MTPSSVLVIKPSSLGDIVHTLPAVHFHAREAAGYHYHERVDVDASLFYCQPKRDFIGESD
jgi:hypothetical protein